MKFWTNGDAACYFIRKPASDGHPAWHELLAELRITPLEGGVWGAFEFTAPFPGLEASGSGLYRRSGRSALEPLCHAFEEVFFVGTCKHGGLFSYRHWKSGAAVRRLAYFGDENIWLEREGEPEAWEHGESGAQEGASPAFVSRPYLQEGAIFEHFGFKPVAAALAHPAGAVSAPALAAAAPDAGFYALLKPSPALAEVLGEEARPRSLITKLLWDYIKQHGLQHPSNPKLIRADAKLRAVFGKDEVSMFEMTKLVNKHLSAP